MKGYIKYLGLLSVALGIILFLVHHFAHIHGNILLFTGLGGVLGGTILYIRGGGY
ncbi:hypothetical protein [Prevotella ihumii]|uniref:hypothetical protein n=1 Tax=Prevotella ihumii TaxID=1917878 RepID=UPI00192A515D|nr:hypothetical protein [Prevotella ihumii]